ncbi:hypothetical protein L5515_011869 [Caenorhabditis briggsae]|uniref:C2H2-type domain-containing protein n=2 Tax=Caenorhabditis briggsae TaxID=6238 RepID=A0AAE9AGE9_CAEBR|nr:hypothetical protein L3Y34_004770 [Caenorhabditis briggsae]UMM29578.1 hypothetical protein L5515_011869 [Caenorhabditis briggsae]
MDIPPDTNDSGRSYGFASNLKRFGASLADHPKYSRREFISHLSDCRLQLKVEQREETPENQSEGSEDGIEECATQIEWENLECPKCHRKVENSDVLTEHLVSNHGKTQDKVWFKQFGTLGSDMAKSLDKALRKQEETSLVKKKFGDSNDLITCPVASPLAPFFMMRHFQVFRDEMCPSATEGIVVGITNDEKSFSPIFCFQKLDKARRRIKRGLLRKTMEKKVKILEKRCDKVSVDEPDIVFKKSRTADETRDLLQALNLPPTGSQKDIVERINELKTRYEEISNVYLKNVKPDGKVMSAEERRLISSLTNDMVTPVAGKRKTTYKNPSELTCPKKRQKTTTPE